MIGGREARAQNQDERRTNHGAPEQQLKKAGRRCAFERGSIVRNTKAAKGARTT